MAEGESNASNLAGTVIGFVVFLTIIVLAFGDTISESKIARTIETGVESPEGFKITDLFPGGDKESNNTVVTKGNIPVRLEPGGSIIGNQKNRKSGTIVEGPVEAYGSKWWRVQFDSPPDGWIEDRHITAAVASYGVFNIFGIIYDVLAPIGWILSVILLIMIFYTSYKSKSLTYFETRKRALIDREVYEKQHASLPKVESVVPGIPYLPVADGEGPDLPLMMGDPDNIIPQDTKNGAEQWKRISDLMLSTNDNDWRQGIIEADILLEQMLERMGIEGSTLGERLKNVDKNNFVTLQDAWEAHKIRNRIAHDGSEFALSRNEADKTWKLFKKVFDEFFYI